VQPVRANSQQLSLFFKQMHAILGSGVSVSHALAEMGNRAANKALRQAALEMSQKTRDGGLWSATLRSYPGLFSPLIVAVITAGEAAGNLDQASKRLADYAEREYLIQQDIKRETWYPKILLFFSLIFPLPIQMFGIEISALTQTIVVLLGWGVWKVVKYFWPLTAQPLSTRLWIDTRREKIPVAGKTVRSFARVKFCRALGLLSAAGVGLSQSLTTAADACGNAILTTQAKAAIPLVQNGQSLASALSSTGALDGFTLQMLQTGEETGEYGTQLSHAADFLETDAETALQQTLKLLYVLIFLVVAWKIGNAVILFWRKYYGV
jgi:type II secretory pathway component PulF